MSKEKQRAANLLPRLHEDGDPIEKFHRRKEKEGLPVKSKKKKLKVKNVGYTVKE
jgi:hypothetical protein